MATKQKTVSDEVRRFVKQLHELELRVLDGTLDPIAVRQPLQDIITGKYAAAIQLPSWYVHSIDQLANVRRWNEERGWEFADSDFPVEIPDFTPTKPLEVLVLAVYLPDEGKGRKTVPGYVRTANELWQISRNLQPNWWQWDELKLDEHHLRLLSEVEYKPGIRWVALDLGAHWNAHDGVRPRDVRGENSAHAEVLAATAHFPQWIQAMDGEKVPYAWLPGYRVSIPGREAWTGVPILGWYGSSRRVSLGADWDGDRYWNYAVPVVREL